MSTSNSSLYDDTPEKFLTLTKKCLDGLQLERSRWGLLEFCTPYVYKGQCKYLIFKLKEAMESARAFLSRKKLSPSREVSLDFIEVCKHLYDSANAVKHFIRSCSQDAWLQAAVCSTDVSDHITSLGFTLEIIRLTYCAPLQLFALDRVYEAEAQKVKEQAVTYKQLILEEVNALRETKEKTSPDYQLATRVYERLRQTSPKYQIAARGYKLPRFAVNWRPSQTALPQIFCVDESCLKEMGKLGRGSFATVHKALWLGIEVAKKTFSDGFSSYFEEEVSILVRLCHPNITSLIGYTRGNRECSIIMELMDEDLDSLIRRRMTENKGCDPPFGILEAIDIMLQIGGGMQYLRGLKIVHRDLKPMNILVKHVRAEGSRGHVLAKVSDFGLSKIKEKSLTFSNQTPNVGTAKWMAPELIKFRRNEEQSDVSKADAEIAKHPHSCDVYSFAMVCYEILTGDKPFNGFSDRAVKEEVLRGGRPKLPNHCDSTLRKLIEQCWHSDPSKRPTFEKICVVLRHLKCAHLLSSLGVPPETIWERLQPERIWESLLGLISRQPETIWESLLGLMVICGLVWGLVWIIYYVVWGLVWIIYSVVWGLVWIIYSVVWGLVWIIYSVVWGLVWIIYSVVWGLVWIKYYVLGLTVICGLVGGLVWLIN